MKANSFFLLLLTLSFKSYALDFNLSVNAKNALVISGPNCDMLLKEESAICDWKKSIDPSFSPSLQNSCIKNSANKFQLTISDCLPEFVFNYQQKKLFSPGANCWGTAMSFRGVSSNSPRFVWPEEMLYWMESNYCRKLDVNEALIPGDIINIFAPEKLELADILSQDAGMKFWDILYPGRTTNVPKSSLPGYTGYHLLLHTETYVSPEIAFGKDSPSNLERFRFHSLEETYGRPRSDEKECQEAQALSPYLRENQKKPKIIRGTKCSYFSQAFRCENIMTSLKKKASSEEEFKLLKSIETLESLQKKLFPLTLSQRRVIAGKEISEIKTLAKAIVAKSTQQLKRLHLAEVERDLLVLEYFSAYGLLKSLEQAKL